jgi:hypothetical protein
VGGSFFNAEDIPAGAQLYMLGFILHDWNDEDCRRILRAVAARMAEDSTIMLVEFVRPLPPHPPTTNFLCLLKILAVCGTCHLRICLGLHLVAHTP